MNVTVMPLSKYMAGTPLRYKWRTIPTSYLPFYARVFSVWENGGIGIDLSLQNLNDDLSLSSKRKAIILKQHNDGINPEAYANALNKIDTEIESPIFAVIFGFVNHFLNETCSFINRTLTFAPAAEESMPDILSRNHRAKRDISNYSIETTYLPNVSNSSAENVVQENNSNLVVPSGLELMNNDFPLNVNHSKPNATSASQVVLFYDFQIVTDNMGPSYVLPEPLVASEFEPTGIVKSRGGRDVKRSPSPSPVAHLLSIDAEGTFVAASSRLHPFLGHLISSGCQRMAPKFAIQDVLLTQCSGFVREDVYCNNIYTL